MCVCGAYGEGVPFFSTRTLFLWSHSFVQNCFFLLLPPRLQMSISPTPLPRRSYRGPASLRPLGFLQTSYSSQNWLFSVQPKTLLCSSSVKQNMSIKEGPQSIAHPCSCQASLSEISDWCTKLSVSSSKEIHENCAFLKRKQTSPKTAHRTDNPRARPSRVHRRRPRSSRVAQTTPASCAPGSTLDREVRSLT